MGTFLMSQCVAINSNGLGTRNMGFKASWTGLFFIFWQIFGQHHIYLMIFQIEASWPPKDGATKIWKFIKYAKNLTKYEEKSYSSCPNLIFLLIPGHPKILFLVPNPSLIILCRWNFFFPKIFKIYRCGWTLYKKCSQCQRSDDWNIVILASTFFTPIFLLRIFRTKRNDINCETRVVLCERLRSL